MSQCFLTATLVLLSAAPTPDDLFEVKTEGNAVLVSANVTGITAHMALTSLCKQLSWTLTFQDDHVAELLRQNPVDLSFSSRNPTRIAELIAVSSGVDVFLVSEERGPGTKAAVLNVVPAPTGDTPNGRRRLREWAIRYYGILLESDLRSVREILGEEGRIRFELAKLRHESGDLEQAAREYERLRAKDRSHPLVPKALLEAARCHLVLGRYTEAKLLAEEVSRNYPQLAEAPRATVVLGRALIAEKKYDDAVRALELRASLFEKTEDAPGICLLLADAYRLRARPDQVISVLERITRIKPLDQLAPDEQLLFRFLGGVARAEQGNASGAIKWLTPFLRMAGDHAYVGEAFIALARASFDAQRDLDAVSAAREARKHESKLTPAKIEEMATLESKAAVRLGFHLALEGLEREVARRGPANVPGLALYLGEAYLKAGQWESGKRVLASLADLTGAEGDQARYLVLLSWWRQGMPDQVIEKARFIAPRVQDRAAQADVSRLVGDAYRALGRAEEAADAYLGRIR